MVVVLRNRRNECEVLDRLLAAVRAGESQALVVRGEPGVGKTALLRYADERASGCRVVRAAGVQSEMELAFAGLHQLCVPMLDGLDGLPKPQADALRTAFGLSSGRAPDRFLVGLAVLTLLSEAAEDQPLVCLVDDAQWLDQASIQTLAFVARRLMVESVGLVFGARVPVGDLAAVPEVVVEGLHDADARALLDSVIAGPLDELVRDQIVVETRGNPLALLELPRGLGPAELAGGFGLPDAVALPLRIEESFRRRLEALPVDTQRLLLVAAAEPVGEPMLLWRAAARLGIRAEAATPAAEAGLVEFGARVRFRHPLVRSAVYRAAPVGDRQAVHAALAEATDAALDPDRRAWHRSHTTLAPDEDIAIELDRSAGRARSRGGLAAAAAFLERAATLTPDPARQGERALAAAHAKLHAGAPKGALGILVTADAAPLDELQRARLDLLRAEIAFAVNRGSDAPPLLLKAARRLEPLDPALARTTLLEAFSAAMFAGPLAHGVGVLEVAEAALAAPPAPEPPRAPDLLLDGLSLLTTGGYEAATPTLRRALGAFGDGDLDRDEELRWLWLAGVVAADMWDYPAWIALAARHIELARDAGALAELPLALSQCVVARLFAGELASAAALVEETSTIAEATGIPPPPYGGLVLAAVRGHEAAASGLIDSSREAAKSRGEGVGLTVADWASAILHNGLGRYEDVLAAELGSVHTVELASSTWCLVELIEAAARAGQAERAGAALRRLAETTGPSGTDWAIGIEARCRALVTEDDPAEGLYRQAITWLDRAGVRFELARARLLYGEWLRRESRRIDAREQLRTAHEMFTTMGAEAFGQRAERELLATGETARKRVAGTGVRLTAQEAQVARLAGDGLSNPEIGTRLFISPRTVQYHLRKVFAKLDISSRNELDRVLTAKPGLSAAG